MDELEAADGMQKILARLDGVFKYDAITELPTDFHFFFGVHRKRSETIQDYTAIFERNLRKLAAHGVVLPDKVVGRYFLRKANLTKCPEADDHVYNHSSNFISGNGAPSSGLCDWTGSDP